MSALLPNVRTSRAASNGEHPVARIAYARTVIGRSRPRRAPAPASAAAT